MPTGPDPSPHTSPSPDTSPSLPRPPRLLSEGRSGLSTPKLRRDSRTKDRGPQTLRLPDDHLHVSVNTEEPRLLLSSVDDTTLRRSEGVYGRFPNT